MAGITLSQAQSKLEKYLAAEEKILLGQTVNFDGAMLTRADLAAVQEGVKIWNNRVNDLTDSSSGGGIQVREVIPR